MRIDRAYKGVSEKTLVLFDDGMCDGPDLEVGEQYLMYTRRVGDGDVPSRGCTRSRHVKYAQEDLEYLNGLNEARPTGTIFGRVVVRTDDYYGNVEPDASQTGARTLCSGHMQFSLRNGPQPVTLVLGRPERFDGDPVERKRDRQD